VANCLVTGKEGGGRGRNGSRHHGLQTLLCYGMGRGEDLLLFYEAAKEEADPLRG
jgi:hypothetical protein